MNYHSPTHLSISDGSDVMLISHLPNGRCLLQNECGDQWEGSVLDWAELTPAMGASMSPSEKADFDRGFNDYHEMEGR